MNVVPVKRTILSAVLPVLLSGGAFASVASSRRSIRMNNMESKFQPYEIKKQSNKVNPFDAFAAGNKKATQNVQAGTADNNDAQQTMAFLREQGLLNTSVTETSIVSGDSDISASDTMIRKVFAFDDYCLLTTGYCLTYVTGTFSCNIQGGTFGFCGGPAPAPEIDVLENGSTTLSENFGNVEANGSSAITKTFLVKNTGNANLTLSNIAITAGASHFSVQNNGCGPFPATLVSGASCSVVVAFATTSLASVSGNLRITSNDSDESSYNIALQGTGVDTTAPAISNVSIANSSAKVGDTVTATITVSNDSDNYTTGSGGISGTIAGYSVTNLSKTNNSTYTAQFTITDGGQDIAAGSNVPVSITLSDSSGNTSSTYNTAITQANDAIYANLPNVSVSTADGNLGEDGDTEVITVSLSNSLNNQWPVAITTALAFNDTNNSGSDLDYIVDSATVTINAGSTSGSVTATGKPDTFYDAAVNENFAVSLSSASAGTITGSAVTVTIIDAESAPVVSLGLTDTNLTENSGSSTLSATLSVPTYENVTVNLGYSGTATSGSDYNTPVSSMTIFAGDINTTTAIASIDDATEEGTETIVIDLSSVSGGSASESGIQQQTLTILDDDDNTAPVIALVTAVTTPTNNSTPNFIFSSNEAGTISVAGSCGLSSSTTASVGNNTVTLTQTDNNSVLADGTYNNCSVTVTDAANNTSSVLSIPAFTIDTTAPVYTSVIQTGDGSYKSGEIITFNLNLGEAGLIVTADLTVLDSDFSSSSSLTDNSDGTYSITTAALNSNGNMQEGSAIAVTFIATDPANNSLNNSSLTLLLDKSAPASLTINTPIEGDDIVNANEDDTVLITGAGAEANAAVNISIDAVNAATTADGSGNWTLSGNELDISALNNGTLTVSATQTDSAGNTSVATTTTITLDNTAPTAVTINTPIAGDDVVNAAEDDALVINGAGAEAGATVNVNIGGVNTSVTADASGNWTLSGSELDISALVNGALTVSATQTDSAGNVSPAATTIITLDNIAPTALTINTPIEVDDIVNASEDDSVLVTGAGAEANASVNVNIGAQSQSVTADASGNWTLSGNELDISALSNGALTVSATQTDNAGNTSVAATTTITLDNSAPTAVTINTPIEVDDIVNASEDDSVLVTGAGAEANTSVNVNIGGQSQSVTADASGNWTLSGSELDISALSNGTLTVSATQTDSAGNMSPAATTTITLDNTAPTGHAVSVDQSVINVSNESAMSVTLTNLEGSGSLTYQVSDGSNSVSGIATISAVAQQITGIDVTTLAEGVLTISAIITDAAGNASAAVTATVTKKYNVAPVLSGSPSTTTAEDAAYSFIPTLTDSDTGDTHTFSIINKPSWADFNTNTGELSGTPDNSNVGSYANITIGVSDGTASASLAPFTLMVTNTNDAPVGQNFSFNLDEAATLTVALANGLLSNATDDDTGDTLTAVGVSQPQFGSLTLNSDGSFSYQHDGSENHADSFTFQVRDSDGALSAVQTVTLTITAVADAPIAVDDTATTAEDTAINFSLVDNDIDAEGDLVAASAAIVLPASKGMVSITNGIATYTPNANETGVDTFTYTVKDAALNTSAAATATVTITPVNDMPVVQAVNINVDEDTPSVATALRSLATDVEDTTPTGDITIVSSPTSGQVVLDQVAGTFVYTPDANVTGQDSFSYTITDSEGGVSLPATVTVNIGAVNDRPVVADDSISTDEDTVTTVAILANDSDVEDSGFNAANVSLENKGTGAGMYDFAEVSVNLDGSLAITPSQDVNGVFSFTYTLTDSDGLSSTPATVTLTINAVNDAPVAVDNTAQLQEEGSFEVNILGNDSDIDSGDSLDISSVTVVSAPSNGQTQVTVTGAIIYTANANYFGSDSFSYTVKDSNGAVSNVATVTMTVEPVNDAPVAQAQTLSLDEDASLLITLLATDIENDSLTYRIDNDVTQGTLSQQSSDSWLYTPTPDFNGSDSFTFIANDGALDSAPVNVNLTVNAVNDAPVATADSVSVNEDSAITISLAASDIEGDTLTYQISTQPQNGAVTLTGSQAVYQGDSHFFGTDSFSFIANDGTVDSAPADISVNVTSVNDVPVISGTPTLSISEKIAYSFTPTAADTEGDSLTFSITNKPSWLSFNGTTGLLSGTASNSDVGVYSNIIISVSDGMDTVSLPAFNVTVVNVNDAPMISGTPALNVDQDALYSFTPTANDIDGDSLSFSIANKPSWAGFDNNTGQLSGTPSNDDVGMTSNVVISVSDGAIITALSGFNITVNNVNDAPTISGTANTTVSEDSLYQFIPSVNDIDGDSLSFSISNKPSWADFNTNTGELSGTPDNSNVGSYANITIGVSDGTASASLAPFTLMVTNTNDAPVGQNFSFNLDEAATLTVALANGLLSNATDDDTGDTLTAVGVSQPQFGSLTLNSDGSFSYQHDGSENHADSFTFQVRDSDGALSAVQTVTLTITAVADAPIAVDDTATTAEDTAINFSLVDNDIDAEGDLVAASAAIVLPASKGMVSITNGIATYTPNANETGVDTFTYTVKDAALNTSAAATATVTITPVNDMPVVQAVNINVDEDTPSVATALRSLATDVEDTTPTGDITIVSSPTSGQVVLDQVAGTFVYTPDANVTGQDSFSYTITDSEGGVSLPATVTVNIGAVNDRPVVADDSISTDEDTVTTVAILANDSDVEDSGFNAANVSLENKGTGAGMYDFAEVSVNLDGSLAITPSQDVNGVFSFTYTLTDSDGLSSTPATVTLTINAVNDAPVAVDNTAQLQEEGSFEVNILGNDSDIDSGDSLDISSVTVVSAPSNGQTQVTVTGAIIYTANANYFGSDSFSYTVKDSNGAVSNVATVTMTVEPVNDAPLGIAQSLVLAEDDTLLITLIGSDIENDVLSYRIEEGALHGALVQQSNDSWLYTPNTNYNGSDSFSFVVNDGQLDSATTAVSLVITAVNDAPTLSAQSANVDEDTAVVINLLGNDIEGDTLTYSIVEQPAHGTATISGEQLTYQSNANYFGEDEFSYIANDGQLDSAPSTVSVTINSVNDIPTITGVPSGAVNENSQYSFMPTATDNDGDNLSFSIENQPQWLAFDTTTGQLLGVPSNADVGSYTDITLSVSDGVATQSLTPFTLTVVNVNDAPMISGTPTLTVAQDVSYSFMPTVSDIDNSNLMFTIVNKPNWATFNSATGLLTGVPSRTDVGIHSNILITVTDGDLSNTLSPFSIDVTYVNAPPVANDMQLTIDEDTNISISADVSDSDNDNLVIEVVTQPQFGSLMLQGQVFSYQPQADYHGNDSFSYLVTDGEARSAIATAAITIRSINDTPVAEPDSFSLPYQQSGRYMLDVLANDSDVDGHAITIVGAKASVGTLSIVEQQLQYELSASIQGSVTIEYIITDPEQALSTGTAIVTITDGAENAPSITAPADILVNATGLFTRVDLGTAMAIDSQGNPLAVSVLDNKVIFAPGIHQVYWQAVDSNGRVAIASQQVRVNPQVSLAKNRIVAEQQNYTTHVYLNGPALDYPMVVPYTISGSADADDHDLVSGEVVIESGVMADINFTVFADNVVEADETLIITLDESLNLGGQSSNTITISEANIAPNVSVMISQGSEQRPFVLANDDLVTITAMVSDNNPDDSTSISWLADEERIIKQASSEHEFTFSAKDLDIGVYTVQVTATDDASQSLATTVTAYFEVVAGLPELTSTDTDNDLLPDNFEGYQDFDNNGLVDHLDAISACNVMPEQIAETSQFLVEGETGACLRKTFTQTENITAAMQIFADQLPEDLAMINTGGYFSFVVSELERIGDSYRIVFPQRMPIPAMAVYRKFINGEWINFNTDNGDQVYSAHGERGYCPAPGSTQWQVGLKEGDWCVQLLITDGGDNDADGIQNGQILDPGGVAVLMGENTQPITQPDSITIAVGEQMMFDVLSNDTDADGDTLILTGAIADFGQISIVDNQIRYRAPADFIGTDTLTYSISDGQGGTAFDNAKVSIIVNSAPTTAADTAATNDRTQIVIDVLSNDSDIDGDLLTVTNATAVQGSVTINADSTLSYQPKAGFEGIDLVEYTVSDSKGATAKGEVKVTVKAYQATIIENSSSGSLGGGIVLLIIGAVLLRRQPKLAPWALLATVSIINPPVYASNWSVDGTLGKAAVAGAISYKEQDELVRSEYDDSDVSWSIGAYYTLPTNWQFGVRYINLGEAQNTFIGDTLDPVKAQADLATTAPILSQGPAVQLGYVLPLFTQLKSKVYVGAFRYHYTINSQLNSQPISEHYESNTRPYFGAQLAYSLIESTAITLNYTHYQLSENDVNEWTLGLQYQF
ncbi:tandem-95 repeat protein [Pseudoalteromonas sp.]|uniref:tandem-95 repeat protein n=1 Tax=Pseudoalteromonas sp. TaxID=53249 RepID=UPI00300147BD